MLVNQLMMYMQGVLGISLYSSPELKAQVSFSDRLSSVICLSVNFSYFRLLLKNHWANFNKTWHKHPWVKGNQVCSNKEPLSFPFPRGDNCKIVILHCQLLKIFFSGTAGQISTKLDTNHPWVKGIQVCTN